MDRITPGGDYTEVNIQVTCLAYNIAKNNWGEDPILMVADGIRHRLYRERRTVAGMAALLRGERVPLHRARPAWMLPAA